MKSFLEYGVRNFRQPSVRLAAVAALLASVLLFDASETQAGAERPIWEHYGQHDATARYWLDDDPGPERAAPQEEVDEQEHVY